MERQLTKLKFPLFNNSKSCFTSPFIGRRFLSGEIMSMTKKGSIHWPWLGWGPRGTPGIVCPAWFAWCKSQAATCNSIGVSDRLGPCCRQYCFLGEGVAGCPHCFIPRTKETFLKCDYMLINIVSEPHLQRMTCLWKKPFERQNIFPCGPKLRQKNKELFQRLKTWRRMDSDFLTTKK